jgi:hypothetical protein
MTGFSVGVGIVFIIIGIILIVKHRHDVADGSDVIDTETERLLGMALNKAQWGVVGIVLGLLFVLYGVSSAADSPRKIGLIAPSRAIATRVVSSSGLS